MSGQLESSARQYELLALDERLSPRDRARARLWVGTALSKEGNNEYASFCRMRRPGRMGCPSSIRRHRWPASRD
ncbi:hypothetical protein EAO75_12080 [Streptomyces sp. uw30]|nr:hypothetical protein EAO75_12080 [Streptomyces sp. uw30]